MKLPASLPLLSGLETDKSVAAPSVERALGVIERDLAIWGSVERRAAVDPRLVGERRHLADLGRDLRALRDCYRAARHPRVREELLREAGRVTRRMKVLGSRLRVRGLAALA